MFCVHFFFQNEFHPIFDSIFCFLSQKAGIRRAKTHKKNPEKMLKFEYPRQSTNLIVVEK